MGQTILLKAERVGLHLSMIGLIFLFGGLMSAITGLFEMIVLSCPFQELILRFVFSGASVGLALPMLVIGHKLRHT